MLCNCCGFDAMGSSAAANPQTAMPAGENGTPRGRWCERCGAALLPDECAALFLDRLNLLRKFGLASHTRLLLGANREDD
jgi:hypothetical protein